MSQPPTMVDLRKLLAAVLVGAVSLVLVVQFMRMVKPAAAREVQAACQGLRPSPTNPALGTLPRPAPDFALQNYKGETVRLSDFRGQKVFLNFWASWCDVCATEKSSLHKMTRTFGGGDIVVLSLASDSEWEPIQQKLPDGSPMTILLDPPTGDQNLGATAQAYGIKAVPESFLVDEDGNITHYFINKRDWDSDVARTCLRAVVDGVDGVGTGS